ncbi:MAG: hypothetical protein WCC52_02570 [Nitrosotalea sp.]
MKIPSNANWIKISGLVLLLSIFFVPILPSYGSLYGYNFQEWKNQRDNFLVQFDTDPHVPIAGNMSTLMFSVQNLQTGQDLQNFTSRITITNSSSNNTISEIESNETNGDFSQRYTFPTGGLYEIFLRVDTPTSIDVSKFTVFVSSPSFQILNLVYLLSPIFIFIGLLTVAIILIARYIYKKR